MTVDDAQLVALIDDRLNGQVAVENRTGLMIDDNGSTFKRTVLVPGARIWRFDLGSGLSIMNMTIVGSKELPQG